MAEGKNKVIVYKDWNTMFSKLTDTEAGKLIKHFFGYINDENPVAPNRLIELTFEPIKQTLKRDLKAWEQKSKKNSEIALERWSKIPKDANASKRINTDAKHADSVSVSDNGSVTVIDTVSIKKETTRLSAYSFADFISDFNQITKRGFKGDSTSKGKFNARTKDGYTPDKFREAVRNAAADKYLVEHPEHLTPEYILRPDKIEKYLNVVKAVYQSDKVQSGLRDIANQMRGKSVTTSHARISIADEVKKILQKHPSGKLLIDARKKNIHGTVYRDVKIPEEIERLTKQHFIVNHDDGTRAVYAIDELQWEKAA